MTRACNTREEGFALIVVTALFVAFALLAAAAIDRTNATAQVDLQKATQEKLSRVSMALVKYSLFNANRYPCPASTAVAHDNASFGASVANCHAVSTGLTVLSGGTATIMGVVPVAALAPYGVLPSDAFDSWNNRIMYVVDRAMTPNGSGTTSSSSARPVLFDDITGATFRSPDFMVISYGRDGLGAIPRTKTSLSSGLITCSASSYFRTKNCDGDLNFSRMPIQASPRVGIGVYYDDLISIYGR